MSSSRVLKGLINEYPFASQLKLSEHIKGLVPCTSVTIAIAARLLRMDDEEFFNTFPPERTAENKKKTQENINLILSGCVQTGRDLNEKISKKNAGFFKSLQNIVTKKSLKEVVTGASNLDDNFGGVQDILFLDTYGVSLKNNSDNARFYPNSLDVFNEEAFKENKEKFNLNWSDFFFVATAGGHTTGFFTRKDKLGNEYFYLTDSLDSLTNGKLEIHDSWQSVMGSLLNKWENEEVADISLLAMKSKLTINPKNSDDVSEDNKNKIK